MKKVTNNAEDQLFRRELELVGVINSVDAGFVREVSAEIQKWVRGKWNKEAFVAEAVQFVMSMVGSDSKGGEVPLRTNDGVIVPPSFRVAVGLAWRAMADRKRAAEEQRQLEERRSQKSFFERPPRQIPSWERATKPAHKEASAFREAK